jgi:hypothetical protein
MGSLRICLQIAMIERLVPRFVAICEKIANVADGALNTGVFPSLQGLLLEFNIGTMVA